jgi:hypothetical protein
LVWRLLLLYVRCFPEELEFFGSLDLDGNAELDLNEFLVGWQRRDKVHFYANRQGPSLGAAGPAEAETDGHCASKASLRDRVLASLATPEDKAVAELAARARAQAEEEEEENEKEKKTAAAKAAAEAAAKVVVDAATLAKAAELKLKEAQAEELRLKAEAGVEAWELSSEEEEEDDDEKEETKDDAAVAAAMPPTLRAALEAVRGLALTLDHSHTRADARTVRDEAPGSSSAVSAPSLGFSLPGRPARRTGFEESAAGAAAAAGRADTPAVLFPRCGHARSAGIADASAARLHQRFSNRLHRAQRDQLERLQVKCPTKPRPPRPQNHHTRAHARSSKALLWDPQKPPPPPPSVLRPFNAPQASLNAKPAPLKPTTTASSPRFPPPHAASPVGRSNPVLAALAQRKKAIACLTLAGGASNLPGSGAESAATPAGGGPKPSLAATLDLRSLRIAEARAWGRLQVNGFLDARALALTLLMYPLVFAAARALSA